MFQSEGYKKIKVGSWSTWNRLVDCELHYRRAYMDSLENPQCVLLFGASQVLLEKDLRLPERRGLATSRGGVKARKLQHLVLHYLDLLFWFSTQALNYTYISKTGNLSYPIQRIKPSDAAVKGELGGNLGGQFASLTPPPIPEEPGAASC